MIRASYALRLDHIGLNVWDLAAMAAFYTGALGFEARSQNEDAALASLLGTRRVRKAFWRAASRPSNSRNAIRPDAPIRK